VKECLMILSTIDPMQNLNFGNARIAERTQPGMVIQQTPVNRLRGRHPAVAVRQQTDEDRASVDFGKADSKRIAAFGLLGRDPPAQVNLDEVYASVSQGAPQVGKDALYQEIALRLQIVERR